jgi:predicted deacetylase
MSKQPNTCLRNPDTNYLASLRTMGILNSLHAIKANLIRLAQDRAQWWAFVNTVMNLRVS